MTAFPPLAEIFLAHAPAGIAMPGDRSYLQQCLTGAVEKARAPWPTLSLSQADFVRYIAEHLPINRGGKSLEQLLNSMHLGDLYLACACTLKVQGAATLLDRHHLARIPEILRHTKISAEMIEDVYQKVSEKLLLHGHIATYSGAGRLWNWIEVIAKRMANREARAISSESSGLSGIIEGLAHTGDPERELIKKNLLTELQSAVRAASSSLSDEQLQLLKFHFRNGLSESKLAKLFSTSQPTISRRLKGARDALLQETERLLHERLGLAKEEFESFIAEVRSRWFDLSLSEIFGSSDGCGTPSQ